jgi:predicted amidophosphoribosyltransferase
VPIQIRRAAVKIMFLSKQQIFSLNWYYPVKHPKAKYHRFSHLILFLKSRNLFAINYFAKAILNSFIPINNKYLVIAVPSHDPQIINGISLVAKSICLNSNIFIDATNAVTRKCLVQSFCKTNIRNPQIIANSININPNLIKNADILLLDDISSSGTSILTIKNMLYLAGAKSVTPLALAQTV